MHRQLPFHHRRYLGEDKFAGFEVVALLWEYLAIPSPFVAFVVVDLGSFRLVTV